MSHPAFTVQLQSITALWPVLISRSAEVRRLSWPAWVAGYMPRWYPRQKTVTHHSPNPLRCNLISPTSLLLRQTNDRINCRLKPRPHQPQCPSNIVERYKVNDFFDNVETNWTCHGHKVTVKVTSPLKVGNSAIFNGYSLYPPPFTMGAGKWPRILKLRHNT